MSKLQSNVLVIGGGVAGIQTSLDLTQLGFKVYMVEKRSTIGGAMAQLDKTFPTLDCSLCILAPKMVEVFRDPNIELLTYSYVNKIEGEAGNYTVEVIKKPRYIKEDLCKNCGDCGSICPIRGLPNFFDTDLKTHAAAHIPFPSSVPPVYLIDDTKCLRLNYGICGLCEQACSAKAIDFSQKEETVSISVGAVVVATGWVQDDPEKFPRLAGENINVVSSMQYERLLSANGPTGGELMRLNDKKHPHKVAFIQCVGSRNYNEEPECKKYCSSICCMAAAKQAIITNEHAPGTETYIFNTEIRAKGKNFYEFIAKSKEEYGVNYVNGRVSNIIEDQETGKLILSYEDIDEGTVKKSEVDMAVIASALYPNKDYYTLLESLDAKVNELGYIDEQEVIKLEAKNIFYTGYARAPKDIPTSVAEGSSCAAKISEKLYPVRFENTVEFEFPPEIEVNIDDEPRVGVLVCQCGINIGGTVDCTDVVDYCSTLPYVVHAEENMYSCSSDSQEQIKEMIEKYDCNRFIVASCTPRTHEPLFQNTLREAGLNPFLFELVNIRDQNSWVHLKEPEAATQKAKDLLRMYLGKVINLRPLQKIKVEVEKASLVVGGGVAGITAALNLARQGFEVYLVEKNPTLGGRATEFRALYNLPISMEDIKSKIEELKSLPNVHISTSSNVVDVHGFVGNYQIVVESVADSSKTEEFKVGTIIVATGTKQAKDTRWQDLKAGTVLTQTELEIMEDSEVPKFDEATIILCVDQRGNEDNQGDGIKSYCSNICCMVGLKNIEKLLRVNPNAHIHVLYREMQFSELFAETLWREKRNKVIFERYRSINDIKITDSNSKLKIEYNNIGANCEVNYTSDLLILATPEVPADATKDLAMLLKVPTTKDGFFLEAHVKLRPIDFATEGIFLCGSAHWPKWIDESISQAYGAAARASILMVSGEVETEGITSWINAENCIGCGRCIEVCPYNAIRMNKTEKTVGIYTVTDKKAEVLNAVCKGCGACVPECPVSAIDQKHYGKYQINKMIDLLLGLDIKASEKKLGGKEHDKEEKER